MSPSHFVILYVESAARSAAFYERLLGRAPVDASPSFVMFALEGALMLGLWQRERVQPPASAPAGGGELAFVAADTAAVRARHAQWQAADVEILQPPTAMEFGFNLTAADPDGHRLRVFAPSAV